MTLECDPSTEVVFQTGSFEEAVTAVKETAPDVVLVEGSSWDYDAERYVDQIHQLHPEPAIIVMVPVSGASRFPLDAVTGTLPRTIDAKRLVQEVRRITFGLPAEDARRSVSARQGARRLTDREAQILDALSRGLTNRAIARELVVSEHTVKSHVSAIYRKLCVRSRGEAARWVRENGLDLGAAFGDWGYLAAADERSSPEPIGGA